VRADFASRGQKIRAERCGPSSGRAVVVLHGCGGFGTFDHRLATELPRFGIATLYVDYFAPTPPPAGGSFCSVIWSHPARLFAAWQQVAVDAAGVLNRRYAHVGAAGWSLGGAVAIAAAEEGSPFDAVAAFSAVSYPSTLAGAGALPPTIFLDGGPRDIIPPRKARALYRAARKARVPSALYVYPNGTHDWPGRQGRIGQRLAARFLLKHLR
jgi:dienelactone hydrolase